MRACSGSTPLAELGAAPAGRWGTARTALECAGCVSTTAAAPTSRMSSAPSLVPTTAWRPPGANTAHRPCPACSIVRRQAPVSTFQTCARRVSLTSPVASPTLTLDLVPAGTPGR